MGLTQELEETRKAVEETRTLTQRVADYFTGGNKPKEGADDQSPKPEGSGEHKQTPTGETFEAVQAERDKLKETVSERDKRIAELEDQDGKRASELTTLKEQVESLQAKIDDPKGEIEERAEAKALEAVKSLGLNPDEDKTLGRKQDDTETGAEEVKGRQRVRAAIKKEFQKKA